MLAGGQVARAAGEERQPLPQATEQCLWGKEPDARCCQLQGERQAVHPTTDFGDRCRGPLRQREVRPHVLRALHEERQCRVLQERVDCFVSARGWARQRGDRELAFAAHSQGGAAGDKRRHAGRRPQQLQHKRGRRQNVLEVVEDEQHFAMTQSVRQPLHER